MNCIMVKLLLMCTSFTGQQWDRKVSIFWVSNAHHFSFPCILAGSVHRYEWSSLNSFLSSWCCYVAAAAAVMVVPVSWGNVLQQYLLHVNRVLFVSCARSCNVYVTALCYQLHACSIWATKMQRRHSQCNEMVWVTIWVVKHETWLTKWGLDD